ncbi:hypothetical protein LTR37_000171 [Vermiconidia calcicola]|uniref:Uncharacterized protein n=1 Tax=Vermiconidia calcicola TaxID=1690605 RepID=A0ACC3NZL4_9PEZI|nr:hypothetical protein LTR37_000171 [Vermiconidia calcicola]
MATGPNLVDLPPELHQDLLEYINSYLDLKSLCLTCKTLQQLATPTLYRSITLLVSDTNDRIQRSLNQANQGLVHTRTLRIRELNQAYDHAVQGESLCRLIGSLPLDSLEILDFCTRKEVPLDMTLLKHCRQRQLRILLLHSQSSERIIGPLLHASNFSNVTSITLYVATQEDSEKGRQVLEHISHVQELSIFSARPESDDQDWAAVGLDILQTLFKSWVDTAVQTPKLQLKNLLLRFFACQHIAEVLAKVLVPAKLERLAFEDCWEPQMALSGLSGAHLRLKTFDNRRSCSTLVPYDPFTENFLGNFKGLQQLRVSTEHGSASSTDFSWHALQAHAETLRLLYIDDLGDDGDPYADAPYDRTISNFRKLCTKCSNLEQLVIQALPYPNDSPSSYESTLAPLLDCIELLPELVSLRLIMYPGIMNRRPDDKKGIPHRDWNRALFSLMHEVANWVLSELHESCPRLIALAIDVRPEGSDCIGEHNRTFSFLREIKFDTFNRKEVGGYYTRTRSLRHYEPCSEIFDDYHKSW